MALFGDWPYSSLDHDAEHDTYVLTRVTLAVERNDRPVGSVSVWNIRALGGERTSDWSHRQMRRADRVQPDRATSAYAIL